jgi:hypothetical protein
MKTTFKILCIAFLLPLAIYATEDKGKYTKNKVIKKSYTVNKDATLNISNKFGNVDIVTNTSNSIEIMVSITTNGDNEEKVQERLNEITVDFEATASNVSAKTIIEKSNNSWSLWGNKNNINLEINYIVKMPLTNNVSLENDYGAISLDKLEGFSKINCAYGKINIGELRNSNNNIDIDYCSKSNIEFMKDGVVNADYSTLQIEKSGRIKLNADYSHLNFGMVTTLDYDCDYGDIKIEDCGNLTGNSDYMHTTVGKLRGTGVFDIDYGSLKINDLGSNFKLISVESSYTQLKFGINSSATFNIEASLSYGNLKTDGNFTFNKEITKTSSKYYEGYFNNPNSTSNMNLKTNYGNITFTTN